VNSIIWIVIGCLIGGSLLELPGVFIGAVVGFLVGKVQELSRHITSQQSMINELRKDHDTFLKKLPVEYLPQTASPVQIAEKDPKQDAPERKAPLADRILRMNEESGIDPDVPDTQATMVSPQSLANKQAPSVQQASIPTPEKNNSDTEFLSTLVDLVLEKTNLVTRVGIVVLFFGVAFLLKYTAENVSASIEVRLSLVAMGATILLYFGWRLRDLRAGYAVLLQGAAVGVWYLVTYAALNLYDVIPATVGFFLMLVVSVLAVALAVMQDSKALAAFAIAGGFLAPILASTGSGSHVMLFSYYAILNVGVVSITWFKAWRPLTLLGFIFTFVIGVAWGVTNYSSEHFSSTEPFLILFILFYIAVVMIFALRKQWAHSPVFDGPLVFGTPVIGFALQSKLVQNFDNGIAWSALIFGLCYLGIIYHWRKGLAAHSPLLKESFLAIGIIFVSLSIPYAFEHDVTAVLWALEGAGGLWLAVRQRRLWGCVLALLAQLGAGLAWLLDSPPSGQYLFANVPYLNAVLIAAVAFYSSLLLQSQSKERKYRLLHIPMLGWGLCWWLGAAAWQFSAHLDASFQPAALLFFVTTSAILFQIMRIKLNWEALTPILLGVLPAVLLIALLSINLIDMPSESLGFIAWPASILCLYWLYNKARLFRDGLTKQETSWHSATFLLAVGLASWEVIWQVNNITFLQSWTLIAAGIASLGAAWLVFKVRFWRPALDIVYRENLMALLFSGLLLNSLLCNFVRPVVEPLNYVPLLNPLDIWQLAVLASIAIWWRKHPSNIVEKLPIQFGWAILGAALFIYINTLLFRTIHISAGIPFEISILLKADLVQTCLSILWTAMGIVLFMATKRWPKRELWIVGVALFGIVVIKLFLVDLANTGTVERIVSFMGVGLLLLAVGYLVPIPEKEQQENLAT